MKEPKSNLYTIAGGARRIRVRRYTVQKWVRAGLLEPVERPGHRGRWVTLGELQAAYRAQIEARRNRPRGDRGEFVPWSSPSPAEAHTTRN